LTKNYGCGKNGQKPGIEKFQQIRKEKFHKIKLSESAKFKFFEDVKIFDPQKLLLKI
jgi:hypothetical protein